MADPTDVDLVYYDLRDSVNLLDSARAVPREVRRVFSRYVELSQRLTSAMRKDFKARQGSSWEASRFSGWTPSTELLKYLRNEDQHGEQIFITVHDHHVYVFPHEIGINGHRTRELSAKSEWQMTNQMLDRPPEGLEFSVTWDDGTHEVILPTRTESTYVLYPRNDEQRKRIAQAGNADVYSLVAETFVTLTRYHEFYLREICA